MKLNKIQKTDLWLIPTSLLTIVSGICLHVAGHGSNHHAWEIWATLHTIFSISFLTLIAMHLKQHKAWIKSFAEKMRIRTPQGKMFIALCTLFAITVLTGLVLPLVSR